MYQLNAIRYGSPQAPPPPVPPHVVMKENWGGYSTGDPQVVAAPTWTVNEATNYVNLNFNLSQTNSIITNGTNTISVLQATGAQSAHDQYVMYTRPTTLVGSSAYTLTGQVTFLQSNNGDSFTFGAESDGTATGLNVLVKNNAGGLLLAFGPPQQTVTVGTVMIGTVYTVQLVVDGSRNASLLLNGVQVIAPTAVNAWNNQSRLWINPSVAFTSGRPVMTVGPLTLVQ